MRDPYFNKTITFGNFKIELSLRTRSVDQVFSHHSMAKYKALLVSIICMLKTTQSKFTVDRFLNSVFSNWTWENLGTKVCPSVFSVS